MIRCDPEQNEENPSKDVRDDFGIAATMALGGVQKVFLILHYNPGSFKIGGKTYTDNKNSRMSRLLKLLNYEPEASIERLLICYDQPKDSTLPLIAESWDEAAKQVSRVAYH